MRSHRVVPPKRKQVHPDMSNPKAKSSPVDRTAVAAVAFILAAVAYWVVVGIIDAVMPGFWTLLGIAVLLSAVAFKRESFRKWAGFAWTAWIAVTLYRWLEGPINFVVLVLFVVSLVIVGFHLLGFARREKASSSTARAA